jgi:hypothetical protein
MHPLVAPQARRGLKPFVVVYSILEFTKGFRLPKRIQERGV